MKNYILFFGIILSYSQTFSKNHNFIRNYGGTIHDDARTIVSAEDGCYAFTGPNKSDQDTLGDTYLIKVNAFGAVVWKKFYRQPLKDGENHLIKCSDGGF